MGYQDECMGERFFPPHVLERMFATFSEMTKINGTRSTCASDTCITLGYVFDFSRPCERSAKQRGIPQFTKNRKAGIPAFQIRCDQRLGPEALVKSPSPSLTPWRVFEPNARIGYIIVNASTFFADELYPV